MQSVIVTFEGSEQNAHDLISNLPQVVTNVGATFVDAKIANEGDSTEETVTGSAPEEPRAGFLGENSEEEKEMKSE